MNRENLPRSVLLSFGMQPPNTDAQSYVSVPPGATIRKIAVVAHTPEGPAAPLVIFDAGDLAGIGGGCACGFAPFGIGLCHDTREPIGGPLPELDTEPLHGHGRERLRGALETLMRWTRDGAERAAADAGGYDGLAPQEAAALQLLDFAALLVETSEGRAFLRGMSDEVARHV